MRMRLKIVCVFYFNYSGGGYNRLSKDGSSDLISKPVGDRKLTIYLPMRVE